MKTVWVACDTCRLYHECKPGSDEAAEFFARHQGHVIRRTSPDPVRSLIARLFKVDLIRDLRDTLALVRELRDGRLQDLERAFQFERMGIAGYRGNANVKIAYGSVVDMTVTNLHSNANSATNVWGSAVVDNVSDLFLDALAQVILDFANTTPANSKAAFLLAYGIADGADSTYTQPFSGSEGDFTVPDFTANPLVAPTIGAVPYNTADEVVESRIFSVAKGFDGILPIEWGLGIINHSGAALAASGNIVTYRGVYGTVA